MSDAQSGAAYGSPLELPDPYEILCRPQAVGYRVKQRERRARILAATRLRIAQFGHKKVTVRGVAELSCVTAQTVYNLVGDRTALLSDAITDHIEALAEFAAAQRKTSFLLALVDTYWQAAVRNPSYMRQVALAYFQLDSAGISRINASEKALLQRGIRGMREGSFNERVDISLIVHGTSNICAANFFAWANGMMSLPEVRQQIITNCSLLLLGAAARHEAGHHEVRRMEGWLVEDKPSNRVSLEELSCENVERALADFQKRPRRSPGREDASSLLSRRSATPAAAAPARSMKNPESALGRGYAYAPARW